MNWLRIAIGFILRNRLEVSSALVIALFVYGWTVFWLYLLCLNENYHNILAYQYGDVPTYCRQVTLFPLSLLF